MNIEIVRSRGPVYRSSDTTLSMWHNHPVEGRMVVDVQAQLHWVLESESTLRCWHGGVPIEGWTFSTYVDLMPFDSFQDSIERCYVPLCKRYAIDDASSLRVEVVTTVRAVPLLAPDAAIIKPTTPYDRDRLADALNANREQQGQTHPMRCWVRVPQEMGIKKPNVFASEEGQAAFLIPRLADDVVGEAVAWHSGLGMPRIPEDFPRIAQRLRKKFEPHFVVSDPAAGA